VEGGKEGFAARLAYSPRSGGEVPVEMISGIFWEGGKEKRTVSKLQKGEEEEGKFLMFLLAGT